MRVWFVTPAFGRYPVTRLALAQRALLCRVLAARGVTANCVIVADDDNLTVAEEYGFDGLEHDNRLGAKINAGFGHALDKGADWVAFVGSDDWVHPDVFDPLIALAGQARPPVLAGRRMSVVSLLTGRLRTLCWDDRRGVPPWLIPRWALEESWVPSEPGRMSGMEGSLARALRGVPWRVTDGHPYGCVDFKTDEGITGYDQISRAAGYGPERDAWETLGERFPSGLVDMARAASGQLRDPVAA